MRRAALVLLLAAGCRPGNTLVAQAGEDSWTTLPPHTLQLRVSKFEGDGTVEVVAPPSLESSPAGTVKGPAVAGTRLDVAISGVPCVVAIVGRYEALVSKSDRPNPDEVRRTGPGPGTRTLRGLNVEVSCGGAPVPGTAGALRGHRALEGLAWGLPALLLAVAAGVLIRGEGARVGGAIGCAALALGAAVGVPFWQFEGGFALTYAVLFVGVGIAGLIAGNIDMPHAWGSTAAGVAGLIAGAVAVAALHEDWSMGGPVVALLGAAAAAAVALVGVGLVTD